jgi:catechol 2,3-dioxygenase-like lactoylglutathione lyase family enzyme
VTRDDLLAALERAAAGWRDGDAAAVGDAFAADVEYLDPFLYRFDRREDLLPFFEPPPGGHHVTWHQVLWDDTAQTGVVEYTYEGHHRYHGAAIVRLADDGRIALWREWQHLDDAMDWEQRLQGPRDDGAVVHAIDHVQLGMPAGDAALAEAHAFYIGVLGMREIPKPPQLQGRGGAWFASREAALHIGVEPDFRAAPTSHPALVVDLPAIRARLGEAGFAIEEDAAHLPVDRCYVRDPFGNRIELVDSADAGFSLG